jgi:hypothetical protein
MRLSSSCWKSDEHTEGDKCGDLHAQLLCRLTAAKRCSTFSYESPVEARYSGRILKFTVKETTVVRTLGQCCGKVVRTEMALSNLSFAAVFVVAIVGCLIVMAIVWWRRPKEDG